MYWVTDSQVLAVWLQKGTKIVSIQEKISSLFRLLHGMRARIIPVWSPRTNTMIRMADEVSKFHDTDDWGLERGALKILEDIFRKKFTCDMFANGTNKEVTKFYLKVAAPGSHGINCFMHDWSTEFSYVCPPVNLVIDAVKYIEQIKCSGVLAVPYWQRFSFWPMITVDGIHLKPIFKRFHDFYPRIFTGPHQNSSAFIHGKRKRMLALLFDSNQEELPTLRERCLYNKCGICA